jgi:hypothetical protein
MPATYSISIFQLGHEEDPLLTVIPDARMVVSCVVEKRRLPESLAAANRASTSAGRLSGSPRSIFTREHATSTCRPIVVETDADERG